MEPVWIPWTDSGHCDRCSSVVRIFKLSSADTANGSFLYRCATCGLEKNYTRPFTHQPDEFTDYTERHQ
jgi:DNA-directed RNA polymerase subunit RPC12/RpoP